MHGVEGLVITKTALHMDSISIASFRGENADGNSYGVKPSKTVVKP